MLGAFLFLCFNKLKVVGVERCAFAPAVPNGFFSEERPFIVSFCGGKGVAHRLFFECAVFLKIRKEIVAAIELFAALKRPFD